MLHDETKPDRISSHRGMGRGGGGLVEERGVGGRGVEGYWGVLARPDVHTFLLFATASEI